MDFRWNSWNIEHIGRHGVDPGEAEEVVRRSRPLYGVTVNTCPKVAAVAAAGCK